MRAALHKARLRARRLRAAPVAAGSAWILLVSLFALSGCKDRGPGGDETDAGDSSTTLEDAGRLDAAPRDARTPDARPDARPDAAPNPNVIELPPDGKQEMYSFSNAGFIATYSYCKTSPAPDVFYFDVLAMQEVQVTDRDGIQEGAYTDGLEIMFWDSQFTDVQAGILQNELFQYTIETGEETRLTIEVSKKYGPMFNDDFILFRSTLGCVEGSQLNLTLMDRRTSEQTVISECGTSPEGHSISDHYAAWTARPSPGEAKNIFVRDLAAGHTFRVSSVNAGPQYFPTTDAERVVWQDHRDGRRELYMLTFSTGVEEILTPDPWEQARPNLRDGIVAWCDYRFSQDWGEYGDCDVYVHEIATGVGRRITAESAQYYPQFVDSGWILYGRKIPAASFKLYMHDLVGDGILSQDGHVIPE